MNHPAKFSDDILSAIKGLLPEEGRVLDPFAGTGRIHELSTKRRKTWGVEIEQEWADLHPYTVHGDSTDLDTLFQADWFDAVATSPTYGNRMADHYKAKDGSRRYTYRTALGHELQANNTGRMQWGESYRSLHEQVYAHCVTVTKDGGYLVLNVKDHIRAGKKVPVVSWHVRTLESLGYRKEVEVFVPSPGMRHGENRMSRVQHESVIRFTLEK